MKFHEIIKEKWELIIFEKINKIRYYGRRANSLYILTFLLQDGILCLGNKTFHEII